MRISLMGKRMLKRLSLFFTLFIFLSFPAESFHCHADGELHPECSICVASHQQADNGYVTPIYQIMGFHGETLYGRPVPAIIPETNAAAPTDRAPPT
jgi:hypothetical protein